MIHNEIYMNIVFGHEFLRENKGKTSFANPQGIPVNPNALLNKVLTSEYGSRSNFC